MIEFFSCVSSSKIGKFSDSQTHGLRDSQTLIGLDRNGQVMIDQDRGFKNLGIRGFRDLNIKRM